MLQGDERDERLDRSTPPAGLISWWSSSCSISRDLPVTHERDRVPLSLDGGGCQRYLHAPREGILLNVYLVCSRASALSEPPLG